ncbi:PREDICTED: uncharacterized protein LOC101301084 isoform 1 [Fragaria vesca subsp. vesca]
MIDRGTQTYMVYDPIYEINQCIRHTSESDRCFSKPSIICMLGYNSTSQHIYVYLLYTECKSHDIASGIQSGHACCRFKLVQRVALLAMATTATISAGRRYAPEDATLPK